MSKLVVAGLIGLSAVGIYAYVAMAPDPTDQGTLSRETYALEEANPYSNATNVEVEKRFISASTFSDVDEQDDPEIDLEQQVPTDTVDATSNAHDLDPIAVFERRSRDVSDAFASVGPQRLSERIDQYKSQAESDDSWGASAEQKVDEWFINNFPDSKSLISRECVVDVCYVDVEMASLELYKFYSKAGRQWGDDPAPGFLRSTFSARAGEEFHRIYFFRDTFQISERLN